MINLFSQKLAKISKRFNPANTIIIIAFSIAVASLYAYLGNYSDIEELNHIKAMQPQIQNMQTAISENPEAVIQMLEKYKSEPKAQVVLFKLLVGTGKYTRAAKLYEIMPNKSQSIMALYAGIVLKLPLTEQQQLKKLAMLKGKVDQRLLDFYQGSVLFNAKRYKEAKKIWQLTLTQIPENDPFFDVLKQKINNLQALHYNLKS